MLMMLSRCFNLCTVTSSKFQVISRGQVFTEDALGGVELQGSARRLDILDLEQLR
jgi:hypothetical protein